MPTESVKTMRLIDADKLSYEAELCIETTDAFQDLIEKQPTIEEQEVVSAHWDDGT